MFDIMIALITRYSSLVPSRVYAMHTMYVKTRILIKCVVVSRSPSLAFPHFIYALLLVYTAILNHC